MVNTNGHSNISEQDGFALFFEPEIPDIIVEDNVIDINVNCSTVPGNATPVSILLTVQMEDEDIAEIADNHVFILQCNDSNISNVIRAKGIFLGHTWISLWYKKLSPMFEHENNISQEQVNIILNNYTNISEWIELEDEIPIGVKRDTNWLDQSFSVLLIIVLVVFHLMMGCKLRIEVIIEVLKRPCAPSIGCICQFVIMPLVREQLFFFII